jgi:hypothetical protein
LVPADLLDGCDAVHIGHLDAGRFLDRDCFRACTLLGILVGADRMSV